MMGFCWAPVWPGSLELSSCCCFFKEEKSSLRRSVYLDKPIKPLEDFRVINLTFSSILVRCWSSFLVPGPEDMGVPAGEGSWTLPSASPSNSSVAFRTFRTSVVMLHKDAAEYFCSINMRVSRKQRRKTLINRCKTEAIQMHQVLLKFSIKTIKPFMYKIIKKKH